ncbi:histidinol dehydrogenase, chloroplastic-like [Zingiber officinale]|uniref:histidinol dehydrogenase, chloroplastic-like n=1 Tax=Zingiber officinale TaxID=94328 RepID=UPI001C4DC702|nr:histidinol dehydrogenase, chloroplastic-like [Zingiber officinale]
MVVTATTAEMPKKRQASRDSRCIASVGLYVPGGTAVLPSTALMLSVPPQIAGCKTIVLATPPGRDGSICKEVLYCAKKAGVTHILKAGGAQAISAMAWGTSSCPKVEKFFGPGNQYVTAAKMILQNSEAMVSIDMPAGPSEVLVIADRHANPVHIAADLLSQAEHGPDSQVVLVIAGDGVNVDAILAEVSKQCDSLPRGEFASKALGHSFVVAGLLQPPATGKTTSGDRVRAWRPVASKGSIANPEPSGTTKHWLDLFKDNRHCNGDMTLSRMPKQGTSAVLSLNYMEPIEKAMEHCLIGRFIGRFLGWRALLELTHR